MSQYKVQTSICLTTFEKEDGYEEVVVALQNLGGYFPMTDLTLEISSDSETEQPSEIDLPETLKQMECWSE
jgi:hypothetical protein